MKLSDAYKMTLESIEFLKSKGLNIEISEPASKHKTSNYNSPNRLNPEKWINVSIEIPSDENLSKLLFNEEKKLIDNKISFDTGSGFGKRDWHLDWSFHVIYEDIKFEKLQLSFDSKSTVLVEFFTDNKIFINDIIRLESLSNDGYKIINLVVNKISINKDSTKFHVIAKHIGYYGRNTESYRNLDLIKFIKSNISIKLLDKDESELIRCSAGYL